MATSSLHASRSRLPQAGLLASLLLCGLLQACGDNAPEGLDAGHSDGGAGARDAGSAFDAGASPDAGISATDAGHDAAVGVDAALAADAGPPDGGVVDCAGEGPCVAHATCLPGKGFYCGCDPGYEGDGRVACTPVAVALHGLRWELPCTGPTEDSRVCTAGPASHTVHMTGEAGTRYTLYLHFRGVVEQKTYTGGESFGPFYSGGTPAADGFNIYRLDVSAPATTLYVNPGTSSIYNVWPIDTVFALTVEAGATITLSADPLDGREIRNIDDMGTPIVVEGVPPAPAPYDGQFLQVDVEGVSRVEI